LLSVQDETLYAERVLQAGANGYIMKQELAAKVIEALRKVLRGETYLGERATAKLIGKVSGTKTSKEGPLEQLTDRELEVLELLGQGLTTRQIADRWSRSIKTVETYREKIKRKL